ncbi:MAG: PH domain-containing protein, partial [Clostridiales Family XIII bacterium]|nr:PH domain-containing protein [Clostridiales Family XIII bacterium]
RGVLGGRDSDSVPIEYEYRLTGKEIFLAGIANSHALISVAVLFGILSGIYGYLDDFAGILNFDMGSAAADAASHVFGPLAGSRAIIIVIVFIVLIVFLIGYVMAVVSKFIAFGGFVIQKRGDRIEVQRGLLARKSSSIVTHRVQTVNVSQGLLMRLLGYAEVRAETASALATQNNNQKAQLEDSVIHPFIKLKNLDGFLAGVLPEFTDRPRELAPLTLRALRRSVTRYGVWSLIILGVPVVVIHHFEKLPGYVFAIAAALWILMLVCGALKWKGRAIGRTERTLAMRRGAVRRQVVYLKKPKIQHATKEVNPFQHAAKMATFSVYTAAAQGKRNAIKDLTTAAADDYLAWTEPGRKKIAISPEI